jgi:CPA2 family monovalent cation:H+ antiporter-2
LLSDNGVEPTIVEMNWQTVERLRAEARPAVYGDAGLTETLEAAGVPHAGTLILSASSTQAAGEIIRRARELNPRIRVLARSDYLRDSAALRRGGADQAFSGEGEVALAMTEAVLRTLGATPEQIDRERDRVRGDLFGTATDEHAS